MEDKKLICPICGKPTRVYMGNARKDGLCGEHADMLKKGLIELKDGVYINKENDKPLVETKADIKHEHKEDSKKHSDKKCLICGKEANGPLCYEHYKLANEQAMELIKNNKDKMNLIVYYRNLKNNMFHMYGEEILQENYVKLMAIAIALDKGFDYHVFYNSIGEDLEKIKESHSKKVDYQTPVTKKMDEEGGQVFRSYDHHLMDSQGEVVIDDILFELSKDVTLIKEQICPLHIPHFDILNITERGVNADWLVEIPTYPLAFFYIEFWGVKNDPKYEKNKQEKIELYKKHGLDLLGIEYEEIKDPNALKMRIKTFIIDRTIGKKALK